MTDGSMLVLDSSGAIRTNNPSKGMLACPPVVMDNRTALIARGNSIFPIDPTTGEELPMVNMSGLITWIRKLSDKKILFSAGTG